MSWSYRKIQQIFHALNFLPFVNPYLAKFPHIYLALGSTAPLWLPCWFLVDPVLFLDRCPVKSFLFSNQNGRHGWVPVKTGSGVACERAQSTTTVRRVSTTFYVALEIQIFPNLHFISWPQINYTHKMNFSKLMQFASVRQQTAEKTVSALQITPGYHLLTNVSRVEITYWPNVILDTVGHQGLLIKVFSTTYISAMQICASSHKFLRQTFCNIGRSTTNRVLTPGYWPSHSRCMLGVFGDVAVGPHSP